MQEDLFTKFYNKMIEKRRGIIKDVCGLSEEDMELLSKSGSLGFENAQRLIENVIGCYELPLGIATNFYINGRLVLIPMALEEPSVVAAASNAAKLSSGFEATTTEPLMIGQVQLVNVKDFSKAKKSVLAKQKEILSLANAQDSMLVKLGGGAKRIEARKIGFGKKQMMIVHLIVDVRDAMGANAVNTMCEKVAPLLEELTGGKARLRILSNLAVHRLATARAVWKKEALGEETIDAILDACEFAKNDVFRATTNNKGIMNGVDAAVIATGNDFRAVEAGAHAYASLGGKYRPLAEYKKDKEGNLVGELTMPLAVGIVGGATRTHPMAQLSLKIMKVKSAQELAQAIVCLGLANNFAALKALATEGIQRGHMKLHSKNIAITAGAKGEQIDKIAAKLVEEKNVTVSRAKELLEKMNEDRVQV